MVSGYAQKFKMAEPSNSEDDEYSDARAVPRIFCLRGQTPSAGANSTNLYRDLPYTDRVSSQTLR